MAMDFQFPGQTTVIDPTLHPLWVPPELRKPKRNRKAKPEPLAWAVAPIPPPAAVHIEGQRRTIMILGEMVARILDALDRDRPEHAATIARETLEELAHALTLH
jgi:hypothetical protein